MKMKAAVIKDVRVKIAKEMPPKRRRFVVKVRYSKKTSCKRKGLERKGKEKRGRWRKGARR